MTDTDAFKSIKAAPEGGYFYSLPGTKARFWAASREAAERAIKSAVAAQERYARGLPRG